MRSHYLKIRCGRCDTSPWERRETEAAKCDHHGRQSRTGKAIAHRFVQEGASVLLCARDAEMLGSAEADLRAVAGRAQKVIAQRCDVSSEREVAAMFQICDSEMGSLHVLVNNAGVYGPKGRMEEIDWGNGSGVSKLTLLALPLRAGRPSRD